VPEGALLARLGGDEFSVLLPIGDRSDARDFAEKVIGRFEQPLTLLQQEFTIGASVGVCYYPEDGRTRAQLMKHADIAMYQAKTGGGNHCRTYAQEMNMAIYRNVELEAYLRKALSKGELELHYQPQMDLRTLRMTGAEALLRWRSGALGAVPPTEFIPVAESTGLIFDIGRWVLEKACMEAKRWELEGYPSMTISVNVSHRQLQQQDFVDMVKEIVASAGLPPDRLCIEITESLLSRNLQSAVTMLDELAAWGARIAMDDFGTGYSSLAMLKRLPALGTIKIDRSFIDEMKEETEDRSMVAAIVWMSHALGKTVVAEGAETAEQVRKLQQMGCDAVQGYYFSKPLDPEQLLELLRQTEAKANVG
jgi:predicted signal transduction protein with EAL and GGDEF domain